MLFFVTFFKKLRNKYPIQAGLIIHTNQFKTFCVFSIWPFKKVLVHYVFSITRLPIFRGNFFLNRKSLRLDDQNGFKNYLHKYLMITQIVQLNATLELRDRNEYRRFIIIPVPLIYVIIVSLFNSVSSCILWHVYSHLEGMCSDCE